MIVIKTVAIRVNDYRELYIGDKINIGKYLSATCQKNDNHLATFLFDQCLEEWVPWFRSKGTCEIIDTSYEKSFLREFLKDFIHSELFDNLRDNMVPFEETGDFLRIPNVAEIFGIWNEAKQWPLMKNRHNRISFHGPNQIPTKYWIEELDIRRPPYCLVNGSGSFDCPISCSFDESVRPVFKLQLN